MEKNIPVAWSLCLSLMCMCRSYDSVDVFDLHCKKTTSHVQRKCLQVFFMEHEPLTQASISERPFLDIT